MASKTNAKSTTVKSTSSLSRARATAANIVAAAKSAQTQPAKATATPTVQPGTARYNYAQRVVVNPKAPSHNGFFGQVQQFAAKPITLEALIAKMVAATKGKLTSKKPQALVVRIRVRHAHSRLGILQNAK
jgi:hypothetical protein